MGISTALQHGETETSVRGGLEQDVPKDASLEVLAHHDALEKALKAVAMDITPVVNAEAVSEPGAKPEHDMYHTCNMNAHKI